MTSKDVQPIFILPENTQRTSGKEAQRLNITAAKLVAETVRTTLGPKGMDKMLVDSFGDSAINIIVYFWYGTKDEVISDMTNVGALTIKKAFDRAGISIPYPIRSVFVEK